MNFIPVIIMNIILLVITVLLAIAERFLATYGECKITVEQDDEKKEFLVQGGQFLLPYLIENNINISSSCGGKATCGYCKVKVLSGGGEILPTEEIFMSREEKNEGVRLACQVKVKSDIEIYIPDFLTTVRSIVENRTFDASLRWNFTMTDRSLPEERWIKTRLVSKDKKNMTEIIQEFKEKDGALVPILQSISDKYNYLPENILWNVSKELDVPLSIIFRAATFYNSFSLKPKGKYIIRVCMGTACYVKGGAKILETLKRVLNIKVGEATKDLKFSLETVACLGCCGQAPVITVNDDIYGYLNQIKVKKVLEKYQ